MSAGSRKLSIVLQSAQGGGIARTMMKVGAGLRARGWFTDIDLVTLTGRGAGSYEIPGGIRSVEIDAPRLLRSVGPLTRYLKETRPETVLAAGEPANLVTLLASRIARSTARTVISVHTHVSIDAANIRARGAPPRLRAVPWLVRRFYPRADAIVAVSAGVADDLSGPFGIGPDLIRVIHNPVELDEIDTRTAETLDHPWLASDRHVPVVLSAGRLVAQKDFETLLRAFGLVRREIDARLIVLGEGPLRSDLTELATSLGVLDYVHMPGFVRNPYAWMGRADVFALSSAWEGFGNVLVEALACGTPVVSTDCPSGPAEVLRGGEVGPLVPVRDPDAMAQVLLQILRTPPPRERLRARARDFSLDVVADAYGNVLRAGGEEA